MDSSMKKAWENVDSTNYAETREEADKAYTKWASTYDRDMAMLGFVAAKNVAAELMNHISNTPDVTILDLAAGTGKFAEEMRKLGFSGIIDGLEINAALLNIAKTKSVYRNYLECGVFANQPLPVEDESYDAITCVGAMGDGHLEEESVKVMVPALKRGGVLICTVRATQPSAETRKKLEGHFSDLVRSGTVERIDVKELTNYETDCRETGTKMTIKAYIYKRL